MEVNEMIKGKATLVVDLGNSETRVLTIFGKTTTGELRYRLSSLDNRFGPLEDDYEVPDDYTAENSRIFVDGFGKYCVGDLCRREIPADLRPSAIEKKYRSDVSKLSMIQAFLQGYIDVANMMQSSVEDIDVEWDVVVLLPPADISVGSEFIGKMVRSIEKIEFIMPKVQKDILVKDVRVMPEGFCAYLGVLFDMRRKVRPEYAHLKKETTLIFDIGAGTTDISVIEDGKIISATKYTVTLGGNNVHQKVKSMLNASGKTFPESMVQEGVEKGFIKSGNMKYPLVKEIAKAKNETARGIVNSVRDFFESSQYPIEKIENLIVCGGGAIDANIDGVHPLSLYLVEYMKKLTRNITLVELPKIVDNEGVEDTVSPRILNVLGAGIASYRE